MKPAGRSLCCELCNEKPIVYCESDSAFLCSTCDTRVHRANFVAARHLRIPIQSDAFGDDDAADSSSRSSSSSSSSSTESCVSSSESAATDRAREVRAQVGRRAKLGLEARAEVVVVDWCRRVLGGGAKEQGKETRGCVVEVAMRAVRAGLRKMKRIPMRCLVAAAVFMAVEMHHGGGGGGGGGRLRAVEECSGVPARVILVVEGKLSRLLRKCDVEDEEGWAECSS